MRSLSAWRRKALTWFSFLLFVGHVECIKMMLLFAVPRGSCKTPCKSSRIFSSLAIGLTGKWGVGSALGA